MDAEEVFFTLAAKYSATGLIAGLCLGIVAIILLNKFCFENNKIPKWTKVVVGIILILGFCALGSAIGRRIFYHSHNDIRIYEKIVNEMFDYFEMCGNGRNSFIFDLFEVFYSSAGLFIGLSFGFVAGAILTIIAIKSKISSPLSQNDRSSVLH